MTKRRKRHPAAASRILAGGASTAAAFAMTTGFALSAPPQAPDQPARAVAPSPARGADVKIVVTDDRIAVRKAVAAARSALRAGKREAYVEVEPLPPLVRYVVVNDAPVSHPGTMSSVSGAPAGASVAVPAPAPRAPHTTTASS
jgi:hypothetical protein